MRYFPRDSLNFKFTSIQTTNCWNRQIREKSKFLCYISVKSGQLVVLRKTAVNRALACFIFYVSCWAALPTVKTPLQASVFPSVVIRWPNRFTGQGMKRGAGGGALSLRGARVAALLHSWPWSLYVHSERCWRTQGFSCWKANQIFKARILLKMFSLDELEL